MKPKSVVTATLIACAACVVQGARAVPSMATAPTHVSVLDFSGDGVDADMSQIYKQADTGAAFSDEFTFIIPASYLEGGFKATTQVATSALKISDFDLYTNAGVFVTGVSAGDASNNWAIGLTTLSKGAYVLEIDGMVTGALGGRYGGTVSLSPDPDPDPLPEPATLGMMAGGLAMMGLAVRRKQPA